MIWIYWIAQSITLWVLTRHLKEQDTEGVYSMVANLAVVISLLVGFFLAPFWVQIPTGILLYRFVMSYGSDLALAQQSSVHHYLDR